MNVPLRIDGEGDALGTLVLAHGAGAPMDSDFMQHMAEGLAAAGARVVRFEFPYMHARRVSNKRGGPDRQPELLACYRQVIAQLGDARRVVIGGKSMGGRMASLIADDVHARGLLCLGYPFHPAGKPTQPRVAHLKDLTTPTLIVQGTRDTLGNHDEVLGYALSPAITLRWLEDGDHSFEPRKKSGRTTQQAMGEAIESIATWMRQLPAER